MITNDSVTRYEARGAMDALDAGDLAGHMLALATMLAGAGGHLTVSDHQTALRIARILRIVQRATQPGIESTTAVAGVNGLNLIDTNGERTIVINIPQADVMIDLNPDGRHVVNLRKGTVAAFKDNRRVG